MSQNRRNRRRRLYNENPNCPFCKVPMILPEHISEPFNGKSPDNMCTIEHLKPSWLRKFWSDGGIIVCCYKCNQSRGNKIERIKQKNGPQIAKIKKVKTVIMYEGRIYNSFNRTFHFEKNLILAQL